jgi:hypothetical protein
LESPSFFTFRTISPVPGIIIIGRFSHGPFIPSLFSDPSEALELFLDEFLLDVLEHLRVILIYNTQMKYNIKTLKKMNYLKMQEIER